MHFFALIFGVEPYLAGLYENRAGRAIISPPSLSTILTDLSDLGHLQ